MIRRLETREADVLEMFAADDLVRFPPARISRVSRVQTLRGNVVNLQDGADLDTTTDVVELLGFMLGWFARRKVKLARSRTIDVLEFAGAVGKVLGRRRLDDGIEPNDLLDARADRVSWRNLGEYFGGRPATIGRWYAVDRAQEEA